MLLAIGVTLDREDEQVKKGKKDLFGWKHDQKAQTKTQFFFTVTVQRFPKTFQWMRNVYQSRRNTKNIMMAAPVTMNSTLDNARVLDPLLKFIFKNWDVIQFIVLLIIKKLPRIIIHFHNFLVFYFHNFLVTICLVILIFPYFLFIRMFLNFHSILLSCSPHIDHLRHFQYFQDLIFDSWNVFQKKKFF